MTSPSPSAAPAHRRFRIAAGALLTGLALLAAPLSAGAATKTPPVPSGLPTAIEATARYVPANTCDPVARPGVVKLGDLLTATYGGSYGISRTCGTDLLATSEHYEGRALDWMHNVRVKSDKKEADAAVAWLIATDKAGNRYANARRLGVMYIIWNNKIWGAYNADAGWRDYNGCAKTKQKSLDAACHRNHVHFSFSWEGALATTSFWTKSVAAPDYGPCRPADLNWAPRYRAANPVPCPRYAKVTAPAGASATLKKLVKYSGMELRTGLTGPIVTTVQKVVRAKATGTFDAQTKKKVKAWQQAHGVKVTGTLTADTWRALLADQSS